MKYRVNALIETEMSADEIERKLGIVLPKFGGLITLSVTEGSRRGRIPSYRKVMKPGKSYDHDSLMAAVDQTPANFARAIRSGLQRGIITQKTRGGVTFYELAR